MIELAPKALSPDHDEKAMSLKWLDSAALARLIEEVRHADDVARDATAYNRTYHRHNR